MIVGRVRRAHGVRGDLFVTVLTDFPESRFAPGAVVFLGRGVDSPASAFEVESARGYRADLLVRLVGIGDRASAQALGGLLVLADRADAPALAPGSYYMHELLGLSVRTTEGRELGEVAEVLETGAADVLIVQGRGTSLIPLTAEVVSEIDIEGRLVTIRAIPGLLPEEQTDAESPLEP